MHPPLSLYKSVVDGFVTDEFMEAAEQETNGFAAITKPTIRASRKGK